MIALSNYEDYHSQNQLMKYFSILLFTIITLASCNQKPTDSSANIEVVSDNALVPQNWIKERVAKAKSNLESSEAGKLVWQAMEAAGGLEKWYSNGPISFQFDYVPRGKGARRNSTQIVDTWNNKAIHYDFKDPTASYGWDGKDAWVSMKDTANFEYNLRFWALTPIFFLAQPFNFDGEGVILQKLDDKILNNVTYDAVKITFAAGTGDASGDYYINYYDKKTHQLVALRYIVSYPKYFKDGGHSPEKIMILSNYKTVNGISLPTDYKTYMTTENEGLGEYVTDITVSKIQFLPETKKRAFDMPEGVHVIDGL